MTTPEAAFAAFLSTGLISLAPNVLLFLFPNYAATSSQSPRNKALLSLGQALAVGGLLGDVFLHTLPDCFADSAGQHHHHGHSASHEHHDHESHHHHQHGAGEDVGVRVLVGFAAFLILDIIVRSLEGGHNHSHSHAKTNGQCNGNANEKLVPIPKSQWRLIFSSAVLLNLLGDALHNFTDGLAIGATFAASHLSSHKFDESLVSYLTSALTLLKSRGGLASMSVFLHEIPHELGDFATLVNAGMSRNMAIGMQFVTAVAAFAGTAVGLFSSRIIEGLGHDVLLPFTAGGESVFLLQMEIPLLCAITHATYSLRVCVPGMHNITTRNIGNGCISQNQTFTNFFFCCGASVYVCSWNTGRDGRTSWRNTSHSRPCWRNTSRSP